jgi:endo-1,4-beta-xylanase
MHFFNYSLFGLQSSFVNRHSVFLLLLMLTGLANSSAQATLKDAYKTTFASARLSIPRSFTKRTPMSSFSSKRKFNTISPENVLKWDSVHPNAAGFNFTAADQYLEFGERNHMWIVGHTLIRHPEMGFSG